MPSIRPLPVVDLLLSAARSVDPKSGFVSADAVGKLQAAASAIDPKQDPIGSSAAKLIADSIAFDNKLDRSELPAVMSAVSALKALRGEAGPRRADVEKALRAAIVEPANVTLKNLDLDVDLSQVLDPKVTEFPATATIALDQKAPKTTVLEVNPARISVKAVKGQRPGRPIHGEDGSASLRRSRGDEGQDRVRGQAAVHPVRR